MDPPLTFILDEAPEICPIPQLPGWVATAAGSGFTFIIAGQSWSQFKHRWTEHGAKNPLEQLQSQNALRCHLRPRRPQRHVEPVRRNRASIPRKSPSTAPAGPTTPAAGKPSPCYPRTSPQTTDLARPGSPPQRHTHHRPRRTSLETSRLQTLESQKNGKISFPPLTSTKTEPPTPPTPPLPASTTQPRALRPWHTKRPSH
ncbi:TraM recognition domain-containing protein [Nonomuraea salmonea]|uniref:TraM recognition domain-containing protein n=1 Tax=Nonomuraea salmonea TaxID=46181 RepID=UPI003CD0A26F